MKDILMDFCSFELRRVSGFGFSAALISGFSASSFSALISGFSASGFSASGFLSSDFSASDCTTGSSV